MHLLEKKTDLTITRYFLFSALLALFFLGSYKTTCAAAACATDTFPTHLTLTKPDGETFNLPYVIKVTNFAYTLGAFLQERSFPKGQTEITLQLYGDFNNPRVYVGIKKIEKESTLPIAVYTLNYASPTQPPLIKSFFDGTFPSYLKKPKPLNPSAPAYGESRSGYETYPQDTLFYRPADGGYYTVQPQQPLYYGYQQPFPYGATVTYPPMQQPPLVPVLIAHLSPEKIASEPVSDEQAILIRNCGTMEQQLALTQKELKAAQQALAAHSQQAAPTQEKPTLPTAPSFAKAAAVPSFSATAFPPLSGATVLRSLDAAFPQLSVAVFPPLPTAPVSRPSVAATPPQRTPHHVTPPAPKPLLVQSLAQPTKPASTHSAPSLQAAAQPPRKSLPDCNEIDRKRYVEISSELKKPVNSDYALCIEHLQQCDPNTSSYLPHVALCVNALNKLNRFPELPELLPVFDEIVEEALKSATGGYQVPLTTYLTKRNQQKSKKRAEEERAQREKEERIKQEEERAQREEKEQIQRAEDERKRKANVLRIKAAREERERKFLEKQEALIAQSGKVHEELPEGTVIKVRPDKPSTSLSHAEKRKIERAQKAAAAHALDEQYESITSLVEQEDYSQALTELSKCEKNSRRFANFLLTRLITKEERITEGDQAILKALITDLLAATVAEKPLTTDEKIGLYRYLAQHSVGDEHYNHLKKGVELDDPWADAQGLLLLEEYDKGDFSVVVANLLAAHGSSLPAALVAQLVQKFKIEKEEPAPRKKLNYHINPTSDNYNIALEDSNGYGVPVAYNKSDGSFNRGETMQQIINNFDSAIEKETFDADLKQCIASLTLMLEKSSSTEQENCTAFTKIIQHFIEKLKGNEQLLINAMESVSEVGKDHPFIFFLFGNNALNAFSPRNQYLLAEEVTRFLPSYLEFLSKNLDPKERTECMKPFQTLQERIKEILDEGMPKQKQAEHLRQVLRERTKAARLPKPAAAVSRVPRSVAYDLPPEGGAILDPKTGAVTSLVDASLGMCASIKGKMTTIKDGLARALPDNDDTRDFMEKLERDTAALEGQIQAFEKFKKN